MSDRMLEQIEMILVEADPVGLIKMGAPEDEYHHEALMIYERINRYNSADKIQQIIYDVFVQQFRGGSKDVPSKLIGDFDSYKEISVLIKNIVGN